MPTKHGVTASSRNGDLCNTTFCFIVHELSAWRVTHRHENACPRLCVTWGPSSDWILSTGSLPGKRVKEETTEDLLRKEMGIYTDMKKEISEISNKGEIKKQKKKVTVGERPVHKFTIKCVSRVCVVDKTVLHRPLVNCRWFCQRCVLFRSPDNSFIFPAPDNIIKLSASAPTTRRDYSTVLLRITTPSLVRSCTIILKTELCQSSTGCIIGASSVPARLQYEYFYRI